MAYYKNSHEKTSIQVVKGYPTSERHGMEVPVLAAVKKVKIRIAMEDLEFAIAEGAFGLKSLDKVDNSGPRKSCCKERPQYSSRTDNHASLKLL